MKKPENVDRGKAGAVTARSRSLERMVRRIGFTHLWVDTTGEGIALAAAFEAAGIEVKRFHRASELPPRKRSGCNQTSAD